MGGILEYPERLVYVRARCPIGHTWISTLIRKLPPPRCRAAFDPKPPEPELESPHCPNCLRHWEAYSDTSHG